MYFARIPALGVWVRSDRVYTTMALSLQTMQEFMLPLECTVGKVCVVGTLYSENAVANSNLRLKVNFNSPAYH